MDATACWELKHKDGRILQKGSTPVTVAPSSVVTLPEMDFCKCDVDSTYFVYRLVRNGEIISEDTVLFTAPKYFGFEAPNLRFEVRDDQITVYADKYAKSVEIDSPDSDFVLSDNYFDMEAGQDCPDSKKYTEDHRPAFCLRYTIPPTEIGGGYRI